MNFIVNKDIEISKGKLSGQVGHASVSYLYSRMEAEEDEDEEFKEKDKRLYGGTEEDM